MTCMMMLNYSVKVKFICACPCNYVSSRVPFLVTDCHVRDGLGWAEELLVNSYGCPVDSELLPPFNYTDNKATVQFLAHKFPYSPTVYYSCSVKICKSTDSCPPPLCQGSKNLLQSRIKFKRDANNEEPATVQVNKLLTSYLVLWYCHSVYSNLGTSKLRHIRICQVG